MQANVAQQVQEGLDNQELMEKAKKIVVERFRKNCRKRDRALVIKFLMEI